MGCLVYGFLIVLLVSPFGISIYFGRNSFIPDMIPMLYYGVIPFIVLQLIQNGKSKKGEDENGEDNNRFKHLTFFTQLYVLYLVMMIIEGLLFAAFTPHWYVVWRCMRGAAILLVLTLLVFWVDYKGFIKEIIED